MKHRSIYVIRPKETLLALLRARYAELEDLFASVLWSKDEGGRTNWMSGDYIAQVKAAFLVHTWTDLTSSENKRLSLLANELLGNPPLHITSFDQWWHIERHIDFTENFNSVVARISTHIHIIAPTGSRLVDEWMNEMTT